MIGYKIKSLNRVIIKNFSEDFTYNYDLVIGAKLSIPLHKTGQKT